MDYFLLLEQFKQRHSDHREQTAWSAQRRLHECLRSAIRHGNLPAGTRLYSSRALAQELKVARNTVVYAYEQLATEGYLRTDRRGSFVASIVSDQNVPECAYLASKVSKARNQHSPPKESGIASTVNRSVDWLWSYCCWTRSAQTRPRQNPSRA